MHWLKESLILHFRLFYKTMRNCVNTTRHPLKDQVRCLFLELQESVECLLSKVYFKNSPHRQISLICNQKFPSPFCQNYHEMLNSSEQ